MEGNRKLGEVYIKTKPFTKNELTAEQFLFLDKLAGVEKTDNSLKVERTMFRFNSNLGKFHYFTTFGKLNEKEKYFSSELTEVSFEEFKKLLNK